MIDRSRAGAENASFTPSNNPFSVTVEVLEEVEDENGWIAKPETVDVVVHKRVVVVAVAVFIVTRRILGLWLYR